MIGVEILFGLVALMAVWHGFKYGVPRAIRGISNRRASSIDSWTSAHPGAPKSARWAAGVAKTIAALRWGPGHFKREFGKAFRDAWDDGKQKYKLTPPPPPEVNLPPIPTPQTGGRSRPTPAPSPGPTPTPPPAAVPNGRPHLHSVPTDATPTNTNARSNTMTTSTIEVVSPETLHAAMQAKVQNAAAELEDARADANRAQAAVAETERTVASLTSLKLKAEDVAYVKALVEPDQQWLAAAQSRIAAADQRLAAAKAALTMASRHVELQAQGAAGDFYRSA